MRKNALFLSLFVGVVLAFVAACGSDYSRDNAGSQATSRPIGAPAQPGSENEAPDDGSSSDGSGGGGTNVSGSLIDRKIERIATLDITAENVASTVAKIEAAAGAVGGFVSQATFTQAVATSEDDEPKQEATIQIRVPAESYTAVMNQLRGLATDVTAENSTTSEVTAEYTDLQARLRTLEATEAQYLTLLARAETIDEILTMQDRIDGVQGQIEQVKGQISLIDNLSAMATITINVTPPLVPVASDQPKEQQNWAREAWANSWEASQDVARVLGVAGITMGVIGAWLLVPGLIGFAGWRIWERGRKREAPTA